VVGWFGGSADQRFGGLNWGVSMYRSVSVSRRISVLATDRISKPNACRILSECDCYFSDSDSDSHSRSRSSVNCIAPLFTC